MNKKIFVSILLLLCLSLVLVGCRGKSNEENNGETNPVPTVAPTEDLETEPPEETEEEEYSIPAGIMKLHPNGANGNTGIYFTMEPNDVPVDTTWSTEFRPVTGSVVQLFRDGETYNVANHMTGMVVKYSDTGYYLRTEEWMNRKYFPLQSGDVLKIEGDFRNSTLGVRFTIDTTYILFEEGLVFFGTEYPDDSVGARVINVGPFTEHINGMNPNGFFACAPENSAPATEWSVEYKAVSEDVIKLIRGGKTYNIGNPAAGRLIKYNDTDYFIKMEQWIIKDLYPLRDGDIVVIEGKFANSATGILMRVQKTYIAVNQGMIAYSSEYPTELPTANVVEAGVMLKHPDKGWTSTAAEAGRLYFTMEPNDIPYGEEGIRFTPRAEANVKLIRNGVTYTVGHTARETIVKVSDTAYIFEFWVLADHKPVRDGDILVVEGEFINSATRTILNISKTYVAMNEGLAAFSTEYPTEMPKANVIDAGVMQKHPKKGWTSSEADAGRLYFSMAPNDAPYSSNGVRYVPNEEACVKLIRDGVTYTVGHKARETIVKITETDYIFEFWVLADHKPVRDGDILLVEGKFTNAATGTVINISKTYVAMNAGMAVFSTEFPEGPVGPEKIQGGTLQTHPEGWVAGENGGMYFRLNNNDAPFSSDWSLLYSPTSASNVKLIRDGVTYDVANPAAEMITKYRENDYYLAFWPIQQKPIVDGDILVIEGSFINFANNVALEIDKSYVVFENGQATIVESLTPEINAGYMQDHPNGWNTNNNEGLYFRLSENDIPYDGWNVEYEPASAASIKLVRDGQTYNIGQPGKGTIVKYNNTDYYLKLVPWTIGDYAPILPGDELIVEGKFKNAVSGVVFNIHKTYITVGEGYLLTFSETAPEEEPGEDKSIVIGGIKPHENGFNTSSMDGLYFSADANTAPYEGWSIEYTPVAAANYKLVRGDETYEIGIPGRGTLVKFSNTAYYLKFGWCVGNYANTITVGDKLIMEGQWRQNTGGNAVIHIPKTVITIGEGYTLTFETEDAEEPDAPEPAANHGPMSANSENGWTPTGGLYFTMKANDLPYHADCTIRYTPVSESCVKLVRNGKTYTVAHTLRETICKYSETNYYYEFWTLDTYKPVVAGDVLIVEGDFINKSSGDVLTIAKTTITFNPDGTATFQSDAVQPEEPIDPSEPEAAGLAMLPWDEKAWNTNGNNGFWFTMEQNEIPADETWVLEYAPVKEDVIRLVRGGETVNIAMPGRGTIVKATDAEYYFKLDWNIGDYSNQITVGDVLIIEGDFSNATNGYTFTLKKTTVTIGENYELTFETEEEEENDVIQVGMMMSNASGVTNAIIYFSLADNDLPYSLTKSDFRPAGADVIKLVRDGVTYEIGDPNARTIVKQTAAGKYRLLRSALTMELQTGDVLIVEGIFTGGNTGEEVYNIFISKTYITIGEGEAVFSTEE